MTDGGGDATVGGVRVEASSAGEPPAMGRGDTGAYYSKWDKLAKEAVTEAEESDAAETAESKAKLGLDSDAPVSEAEDAEEEA